MNLDLEAVAKAIYVGLLLLFLAAMDKLQINDPVLRNAAFGLIGTITTWHGVMKFTGANSAVQTLQQMLTLMQPSPATAQTSVVTVSAPVASFAGHVPPRPAPPAPAEADSAAPVVPQPSPGAPR